MDNGDIKVLAPDESKIACKDCKWAVNGVIKSSCCKFRTKPYNVYYENEMCDKFAPKIK